MKKKIIFIVIGFLGMSLLLGCNKNPEPEPLPDTTPAQQLSVEETLYTQAVDECIHDATRLAFGPPAKSSLEQPCGASFDSTLVTADSIKIYITFNGNNCKGTRFRTGHMIIHRRKASPWIKPGTTIVTELIDYQITNLFNNKKITLNGKSSMQNVSGGNIMMLGMSYNQVIHRYEGHFDVTFPDGSHRLWHHARQIVLTLQDGDLIRTIEGYGNVDGFTQLFSWGVLHNGKPFYNQTISPLVISSACGDNPVAGVLKESISPNGMTSTITYGFDANNQPSPSGTCPSRYKLEWQLKNKSGVLFLPIN
ncbi:MAG: hypothetical protein ACP5O2_09535 [Bacteroidales bacterium]